VLPEAAPIDPEAKQMLRTAGFAGAAGLEMAVAIAIGYFGGRFLDSKLDTTPWLTWIGFAAGVGAAVKAIVRVVRIYQRSLKEEEKKDGPPKP
jgi:F0F1-type ATP synthase assembly protein I